jgi:RNA polymerase sigma-70 factor, ECF subfamily
MEEATLWDKVRGGDRAAFSEIYGQYSPQIRAFVRHYVYDLSAADDLVQATFLSLWKRPSGFQPERGTLKQYLFGIARKHASQHRRAAVAQSPEDAQPHTGPPTDTALIRIMVMKLEPDQRALLWLREIEGYSYSELAAILDIPEGTVKSRLFSAREALRRIWHGEQKT